MLADGRRRLIDPRIAAGGPLADDVLKCLQR
jgi:hypothetical protein